MGKSTKTIGKKDIAAACPACQNTSLSVVGFQNVFTLFWIPMFPLGQNTHVVCGSCGSAFPCKLFTTELSNTEIRFKTRWWYFSGSALFIILFMSVMGIIHFDEKARNAALQRFLANPQPGASFVFWSKEAPNFSIGKVEGIEGDKILLRLNRHSHNGQGEAIHAASSLRKNIKLPTILTVTQEEFKHMEICNYFYPDK